MADPELTFGRRGPSDSFYCVLHVGSVCRKYYRLGDHGPVAPWIRHCRKILQVTHIYPSCKNNLASFMLGSLLICQIQNTLFSQLVPFSLGYIKSIDHALLCIISHRLTLSRPCRFLEFGQDRQMLLGTKRRLSAVEIQPLE